MISLESLRGLYRSSPSPSDLSSDREPEARVAVVTCMDHQLRPERSLGIPSGRAHVVRNAGGRVPDDALRSLVLAPSPLDPAEIVVVHHTQCRLVRATHPGTHHPLPDAIHADAS